jgi:hypothetical protein
MRSVLSVFTGGAALAAGTAFAGPSTTVDYYAPGSSAYTVGTSNSVTVVGPDPEFYYDYDTAVNNYYFTGAKQYFGANRNAALGSINSSEPPYEDSSYDPGAYFDTYYSGTYHMMGEHSEGTTYKGDNSIDVSFEDAGITYDGVADFDASEDLLSITYAAVPEPEAWALLIAGTGLVGGLMRRRRARAPVLA